MTDLVESKTELSTNVNYGATDDITHDDCELGRVAIMQSQSDLVKTDQARAGAIINLADTEELGYKAEDAFEFIIVGSFRYWIQKDEADEFIPGSKQPAVNQNERPWEDGGIKNIYHHAFIVLNVKDLEDGFAMPYELAFRSTEVKSAKRISSLLMKLRGQGKASWDTTFKMTTEMKSKGKHSWFGSVIKLGDVTKEEYVAKAKEARDAFNASKAVAMQAHMEDQKPAVDPGEKF